MAEEVPRVDVAEGGRHGAGHLRRPHQLDEVSDLLVTGMGGVQNRVDEGMAPFRVVLPLPSAAAAGGADEVLSGLEAGVVVGLGRPGEAGGHDSDGGMDAVQRREGLHGEAVAGDGSDSGELCPGGEGSVQAEQVHRLQPLRPHPYLPSQDGESIDQQGSHLVGAREEEGVWELGRPWCSSPPRSGPGDLLSPACRCR